MKRGYTFKTTVDFPERKVTNFVMDSGKVKQVKDVFTRKPERFVLVPTKMGTCVNTFLEENFPFIMNYTFTSDLEDKLDLISEGNAVWNDVIGESSSTSSNP